MNNANTDDGAKENPGSAAVPKDARATGHYEEVNERQSKKNSRVDSNYDDIRDSNYETIDEDEEKRGDNSYTDDHNYDDYLKPVTNGNNDLDAYVDVRRLSQGVNPRKQTRVNFFV